MSQLSALLRLIRPYNSLLPILLIYIGTTISDAHQSNTYIALLTFFLLHSSATLQNDLADTDIDKSNKRDMSAYSLLSRPVIVYTITLSTVIALLISIAFLPIATTILFIVLVALTAIYNLQPLRLSKRPLGSIVVLGLCYGAIPFLIGISLGGSITITAVLLSTVVGIGRTSLSMLKDYKDAHGDAQHSKKTFLLVYGRTKVRITSVILSIIGYFGASWLLYILLENASLLWPLVGSCIGIWLAYQRIRLSPQKSYEWLNRQFHNCLDFELIFYGYLLLWLTISLA